MEYIAIELGIPLRNTTLYSKILHPIFSLPSTSITIGRYLPALGYTEEAEPSLHAL